MSVAAAPNATYAFCAAFFEELARAGVERVCISPLAVVVDGMKVDIAPERAPSPRITADADELGAKS